MSVLSVSPTPQVAVESYEVDSSDVCRFRINISVGARSWSGKRLLKSIFEKILLFNDILLIKPHFFKSALLFLYFSLQGEVDVHFFLIIGMFCSII